VTPSPIPAAPGPRPLIVAVIVPVVISVVFSTVAAILAGTGPSIVAVHWGFSGGPNGYGSAVGFVVLLGAISLGLVAVLGGAAVIGAHQGRMTVMLKVLAVSSGWLSILLGVSAIGALLPQRTAASIHDAQNPSLALAIGVVVATAVAVVAWRILPKAVAMSRPDESTEAAVVELGASERVSWIRSAAMPRRFAVLLMGALTVVTAGEVVLVVSSDSALWWVSLVPVVVILLVLSSLAWTVRIEASGVRIRSVLGLPVFSIPMGSIQSAAVVEVSALSDFGGWGVRFGAGGRMGIIVRSGKAIEIHRENGLVTVVTVDDADTAAGLINAFVRRRSAVA